MSRDFWKNKLNKLNNKNQGSSDYVEDTITWSPPSTAEKDARGNTTLVGSVSKIRIVPYKGDTQNPFIETYMYYKPYYNYKKDGVSGKVSPKTVGDSDPIDEFISQELAQGMKPKDEYRALMSLQSSTRWYLPIIVRGEEEKGVRFWGFGKQMYEELLKYYTNEQYGDLHDPKTGRDIELTYKTKDEVGNDYGKTSIMVDVQPSHVTTDKSVLQSISNQPDLFDSPKMQIATYEELQEKLDMLMGNTVTTTEDPASNENQSHAFGNYQEKVSNVVAQSETTSQPVATESVAVEEDEFDNLFGKN